MAQSAQNMNQGMRDALNQSVSQEAMKKAADMMTKTAKMLAMGHLDPAYMMETMTLMQSLMPSEPERSPEPMPTPEMGM